MDYKVIITPRKLCDAGMEALAAQANYEVVDKVNACNFLPELQKADALMIKEGGIGREDMLACPDLKVIARHGVGFDTVDAKAAAELGIPHYAGCKRAFRCRAHRRHDLGADKKSCYLPQ